MTSSIVFEADIILAGGGTAACVIAGRVAAAEPSLKILMIEAGPPTLEDDAHVQPARYLSHLLPDSTTVKFNVGKESADLGGRAPIVPCGQCIGGGSSVNFTMYARPSPSDYDDWENVYGNKGWGSRDLIPFLQKMETYQVTPGQPTHGYEGPIKVSRGGIYANIGQDFFDAATQYDKSRGVTEDPNDMIDINVYGRWQKYIDQEKGRRSDTPHHYVYNQQLDNLEILTGYQVKRVIVEDGRAAGVEFVPNVRFGGDNIHGVRIAKARQLVVVSAGAFGSPPILERSGIGARHILEPLGIDVVSDLPGVGENYQDHNIVFVPYKADDEAETLDGIVNNDKDEVERWTAQWQMDGSGKMASNGIDAGVKLRPSAEELELIGPSFTKRWQEVFANAPDKPVLWLGLLSMFVGDRTALPPGNYSSIAFFSELPASIGYLHITSADDVDATPDFDPKFFSKPEDVAVLRWAYKYGREIARRMSHYRGEYLPGHPVFPEGSQAACSGDAKPTAISASKIVYNQEDDKAIDDYLRKVVATTWHSLGTCAMKPREQDGVVDSNLNVYGVSGLKVADMSIAPSNVCANTCSTAIAIGEKASTIILKELSSAAHA
ncbi:alcohol oxidase-like protein [Rhodofomes roseus]|uniref:Alcohol oxidase-like protein n=1 Tax=Rhodofomes roseus TaxID=34475 RepID=A0ABQ8KIS3_9APHY|nr:alcohol oxidase-like protein [Rhodofomes roseus]KAH9837702.1 alcohol oxidase-like protein [Rhodofomes roseus]